MPCMSQHFLCFADLSSKQNVQTASNDNSPSAIDSSTPAHLAEIYSHPQHPTIQFKREIDKKCSFVLENPVSLICDSDEKCPRNGDSGGGKLLTSSNAAANDGIHRAISGATQSHTIVNETVNTGKKQLVAMATITSRSISGASNSESKPPSITHASNEIFLFGGLELITNVKTIEVYVSRPIDASLSARLDEVYLTTCKGIPIRDLPPLTSPPKFIGDSNDVGFDVVIEKNDFFKFVLVSPGGAKPVERVRLKFVGGGAFIVVRLLKVKCKLSDTIPSSTESQIQTKSQLHFPNGGANGITAMHNIESTINTDFQSAIPDMPGPIGAIGMTSIASQQQGGHVLQRQLFTHGDSQYQHQEKNHAEVVNAIAGLGIFLKHSEERTMAKLDTMLSNMEMRVMNRMDAITERLNTIERTAVFQKPNNNMNVDDEII
jgi:hypothetical protein